MNKKSKIISFTTGKEIPDNKEEMLDAEYLEEEDDFEEWEAEYALTEAEDWEGLIKYYQVKIDNSKSNYYVETCVQIARVYTEELKQYQKAIDYLKPYHEKEPDIEIIKNEITLAQNFIDKKEITLTKQQIQRCGSRDVDMLGLFDDQGENYSESRDYKRYLNKLFKKYLHLAITTDNIIYGVNQNRREKITQNDEAYIIAHDIYYF